jgi:hypothetical protein
VEDLREHYASLAGSSMVQGLGQLPAVRGWLDSDRGRALSAARTQIEAFLHTSLADIRDDLLGDAVVFSLQLGVAADGTDDPRGLLLLRARDRELLDRLVRLVNDAQLDAGELERLGDADWHGVAYRIREYPAASGRASDYFIRFDDGTFAMSNSEVLIRGVIDRKVRGPSFGIDGRHPAPVAGEPEGQGVGQVGSISSLAEASSFRSVAGRLPGRDRALARLFVNPAMIRKLIAATPDPADPAAARVVAQLEKSLTAIDYAGASLSWKDGILALDVAQVIDPERLAPWMRRWAGDSRPLDHSLLQTVPRSALAVGSPHADLVAARELLRLLVPADDQPRLDTLELALSGLFQGRDLIDRVLPLLGPGLVVYVEPPGLARAESPGGNPAPAARDATFPIVAVVQLGDEGPETGRGAPAGVDTGGRGGSIVDAADNAFRTLLALTALDEKRAEGRSRVSRREVAGTWVSTLEPAVPFAYAVDRDRRRLVLGTSPAAVARWLEAGRDRASSERFQALRERAFPEGRFACIDLRAVSTLAGSVRDQLARELAAGKDRPVDAVARDLDQVLGLANLFEAVFLNGRIEADARSANFTLGLIARDAAALTH